MKIAKFDLDMKALSKGRERIPCVFYVQLMDPGRPGMPFKIPRIVGTDDRGILEIEATSDLMKAMWDFRGAFHGTRRGDSVGWNLRYIYDRNEWMEEAFGAPDDLLGLVRFGYEVPGGDLRKARSGALIRYMSSFGEPPVLQGQSLRHGKEPLAGAFGKAEFTRPALLEPKDVKGVPCIYWAHLMDAEDPSRPLPLNRFHGTDPLGRLMGGKTRNLQQRLWQIWSDLVRPGRGSEWGLFRTVLGLCGGLRRMCGPLEGLRSRLGFSYMRMDRGRLGRGEVWALDGYIGGFSEMPPVNSQIPGDTRWK